MIISMHIGAHCTYGPQLMRGLLKNKTLLAQNNVLVPGPARYRDILPEVMKRVKDERATAETQEMVLDEITDGQECSRVILSYEDVICHKPLVFQYDDLYAKAGFKLPWLRNIFADHDMEFVLGLRNPATFIPEVFGQCGPTKTYQDFIGKVELRDLRWSNTIERIRTACPDVPLHVFAYEDTPIIWSQVMRSIAGIENQQPMAGGLDILAGIMQREGMKRLRTYLHTHQPQNEEQMRRILTAFLDKYADMDAIEEEIDLPGWDNPLVDDLSNIYEDDLAHIENMSDVNFIT